jgi:4-alpha-glucanotransferase
MRESGILLPVSALPSQYGIGCFSKEAYKFVDFLEKSGQTKWQLLPLGPTGFGDSPYQSFSTFAGNPYYIDPKALIELGLLTCDECDAINVETADNKIDYENIYRTRFIVLKYAYHRFEPENYQDYDTFIQDNDYWLNDYSLFMVLKDKFHGQSWINWEEPYRYRDDKVIEIISEEYKDEIGFYNFLQYMFWKQWHSLHEYALQHHVEIIGDLPIYVAFDSVDTWSNPSLFQLDDHCQPIAVAGCPPDAFAPLGQLWGNPLYRWDYHKETKYQWWTQRLSHCFKMYDVLRLDHFRAFDSYYSIPATEKTAEHGSWKRGPGIEFFEVVKGKIKDMRIIAEDLGFLTDSVRKLVETTGYPGMKILQFAFDSREKSNYLPYYYTQNSVVYTGTHDNDTIVGWYNKLNEDDKRMAIDYINAKNIPSDQMYIEFIRLAQASVSNLCVIPIQDYLGMGSEGRINTPSTVGNNWTWRLQKNQLTQDVITLIGGLTKLYGRIQE